MESIRVIFALFLIASGLSHFLMPKYFTQLVPAWLGSPGLIVKLSGVADMAVGAFLFNSASATAAAWAAAALLSVYMTSHVDAIWHAEPGGDLLHRPVFIAARIIANLGYIGLAIALAL